jgi:hypothetical protein
MAQDIKQGLRGVVVVEQKSRRGGPRTPQGKARSRLNAVKSGIFAKLVLTSEPFREREADFHELLAELRKSIQPQDSFEEVLVENLTLQLFRLARFFEADAVTAPVLFRIVHEKMSSDLLDSPLPGAPREEPFCAGKLPAADLLMRYESAIWRQIDRIVGQLERWKKIRGDRARRESGGSGDSRSSRPTRAIGAANSGDAGHTNRR